MSCSGSSMTKSGKGFKDLVGGFGPYDGFGIVVMNLQVAPDRGLEFVGAAEGAAANSLRGQRREPALDQVEPRGAGGGEVHVASMGPRSRERGNSASRRRRNAARPASMGPRSRERGNIGSPSTSPERRGLQWGRAHVSAEMWSDAAHRAVRGSLQWGRAHVSAEISPAPDCRLRLFASMGPRSRERGNEARRAPARSRG